MRHHVHYRLLLPVNMQRTTRAQIPASIVRSRDRLINEDSTPILPPNIYESLNFIECLPDKWAQAVSPSRSRRLTKERSSHSFTWYLVLLKRKRQRSSDSIQVTLTNSLYVEFKFSPILVCSNISCYVGLSHCLSIWTCRCVHAQSRPYWNREASHRTPPGAGKSRNTLEREGHLSD